MATDYYAVLGVAQNATSKQIRLRFLDLARERHPDRFQGDQKEKAESDFQSITEAFNILMDSERRRQVDSQLAVSSADGVQSHSSEAARVYVSRGVKSLKSGELSQAIDNFEMATREDPENASGWFHLSSAYAQRPGGKIRAREAIAKACQIDSMNAVYLKAAGKAFDEAGIHAQAAKYYKEALDWGGEDAEVRSAFQLALRAAKASS